MGTAWLVCEERGSSAAMFLLVVDLLDRSSAQGWALRVGQGSWVLTASRGRRAERDQTGAGGEKGREGRSPNGNAAGRQKLTYKFKPADSQFQTEMVMIRTIIPILSIIAITIFIIELIIISSSGRS